MFYWQVLKHEELEAIAQSQYQKTIIQSGKRGELFFADGQILVTNQEVYRLFAQPHLIEKSEIAPLAHQLSLIFTKNSISSQEEIETMILEKLSRSKTKWISLFQPVDSETKSEIEKLNKHYLGFDTYYQRYYPEGSTAAHLVGFVGKNSQGDDVGYFGLEGGLQQELQPRSVSDTVNTDALGNSLDKYQTDLTQLNGRSFTTTINRSIQHTIEQHLNEGINKYGATAGEIIVTQPKTGKILALAASPSFDPSSFYQYNQENFRNPSLSTPYEPGSTFKVITVASGIDAKAITPNTVCTNCSGPRKFGRFTIRTWNDQYQPNITMTEGLAKSDNIAMIFAAEATGADTLRKYIKNFGIGSNLGLDLQGDQAIPIKNSWAEVELATVSFGQGILTTSLQLVQAIGAIANHGQLMQLQILNSVFDPVSNNTIEVAPKAIRQVIQPDTAAKVTQMMVTAAESGEAKWTYQPEHTVAGKTGTSQVANAGGYDSSKTIASFIGFAPAQDPQFLMFVKLVEPKSSPWAAETAAPLWYQTAEDLYLLLNIPPDKTP